MIPGTLLLLALLLNTLGVVAENVWKCRAVCSGATDSWCQDIDFHRDCRVEEYWTDTPGFVVGLAFAGAVFTLGVFWTIARCFLHSCGGTTINPSCLCYGLDAPSKELETELHGEYSTHKLLGVGVIHPSNPLFTSRVILPLCALLAVAALSVSVAGSVEAAKAVDDFWSVAEGVADRQRIEASYVPEGLPTAQLSADRSAAYVAARRDTTEYYFTRLWLGLALAFGLVAIPSVAVLMACEALRCGRTGPRGAGGKLLHTYMIGFLLPVATVIWLVAGCGAVIARYGEDMCDEVSRMEQVPAVVDGYVGSYLLSGLCTDPNGLVAAQREMQQVVDRQSQDVCKHIAPYCDDGTVQCPENFPTDCRHTSTLPTPAAIREFTVLRGCMGATTCTVEQCATTCTTPEPFQRLLELLRNLAIAHRARDALGTLSDCSKQYRSFALQYDCDPFRVGCQLQFAGLLLSASCHTFLLAAAALGVKRWGASNPAPPRTNKNEGVAVVHSHEPMG